MKFTALATAAFVSTHNRNERAAPGSTRANVQLNLLPLLQHAPVVDLSSDPSTLAPTLVQSSSAPSSSIQSGIAAFVQENLLVPPAFAAESKAIPAPPSNEEVKLLREAFAVFYGVERDLPQAESLLSQVIDAWQRQSPDEKAGLYRVRADCYVAMLRPSDAVKDYGEAIRLLGLPGGELADESELPASLLGQARALRSQGQKVTKEQAETAAKDYQLALRLSAREDWDTNTEAEEDGAKTNPFACWEWGAALRLAGQYQEAARVHTLASDFFEDIGDRARSVISELDAGIDLAATGENDKAAALLKNAIQRTKTVEGRDIQLLQRVIAKEGEGRMALASVLWVSGDRTEAEAQLGKACERLDQLEADAQARVKAGTGNLIKEPARLKFNIDDGATAADINCSRFKNQDYVSDRLEWPASLQQKLNKLESLAR